MENLSRYDLIAKIREVDAEYEKRYAEMEEKKQRIIELKKQVSRYTSRRQQQLFEQEQLTDVIEMKRKEIKALIDKARAASEMKISMHKECMSEYEHEMQVKAGILEKYQAEKNALEEQLKNQQVVDIGAVDEQDKISEEIHVEEINRDTLQKALDDERVQGKNLANRLETLTQDVKLAKTKYEENVASLNESNALLDELTMVATNLKSEQHAMGAEINKGNVKSSLFDEVNVNRLSMQMKCVHLTESYNEMKNMRQTLLRQLEQLKIENSDLNDVEKYYNEYHIDWMHIEKAYAKLHETYGIIFDEIKKTMNIRSSIESKVIGPFQCDEFYKTVEKFDKTNIILRDLLDDMKCVAGHYRARLDATTQETTRVAKYIADMKGEIKQTEEHLKLMEPLTRNEEMRCICSLKTSEELKKET